MDKFNAINEAICYWLDYEDTPEQTNSMTEIEPKYGFPLFTRQTNNVYLGNSKKLIISDIWSFWDYVIKKSNYDREFMDSLLEQAKNFYNAAENSPIKSRPLLYYYSFLNLAKVAINIDKRYGRVKYMHGLGENHQGRFSNSTITILQKKTYLKNVSSELLESLDGNTLTADVTINIKDYLAHCVGVHRAYSEIYNINELFYRIEDWKIYKDGKKYCFKARLIAKAADIPSLTAIGYNIIDEEGIYYWSEEITTTSYSTTRNSYFLLSQNLRAKGIWYFIGNDGYTIYISNHTTNRYSPETIIYNSMFFLGSITRYHPYMFERLFSDKEQWLMSEFLTTQPKQLLYLMTAKILGQNVLKAYSSF
jgi:hypothetical protein